MKILLASLIALTPVSAVADEYQRGYSASRTCYKSEYREEYVPGTADNPGYIKSWNETGEVPCRDRRTYSGPTFHQHTTVEYDTNDCTDAVMQLFFGRDCRWTEGFDDWGNPKERRSTTYNNNKINF